MFIEFGILSYKLLLLLLHPIFNQIRVFETHKNTSPLYDSFTSSISYLSAGLVYLLIFRRSKNLKQSSNQKNTEGTAVAENQKYIDNQMYIEKKKVLKERKIKELPLILLLSFINLISMIIETLAAKEIYETTTGSLGTLFYILFYVAFSKIILKSKTYNHQYFSLFIIIACLLIYLSIDIIQIGKTFNFVTFLKSIVYFIVVYGLYSLYDVLTKKHFVIYSNIPYELMFYIGLFSLVLLIPLDFFVYIFNINIFGLDIIDQSIKLFSSSPIFILWFIFDIIVGFFWLGGIVLTLYYFTPCHFIISETLCQFLTKIIGWIIKEKAERDEYYLIIIHCFLYCIIFFSSLIYNEVLILKIWHLELNTFKYISIRQKIEFENLQNNDLLLQSTEDAQIDEDEEKGEKKTYSHY